MEIRKRDLRSIIRRSTCELIAVISVLAGSTGSQAQNGLFVADSDNEQIEHFLTGNEILLVDASELVALDEMFQNENQLVPTIIEPAGVRARVGQKGAGLPSRTERVTLELSFHALNLVDLFVSLDCRSTPDCSEGNPLFGKHPSALAMVMAKVGASGLHLLVSHKIWQQDPELMRTWQYGSVVLYGGVVGWNFSRSF